MKKIFNKNCLIIIFILALSLVAMPAKQALAAEYDAVWQGSSGDWSDATKWDIGMVPNNVGGDTFDVIIPSGKTVIVDMDVVIQSLSLEGGTINGDKNLEIYGEFVWVSGTMKGIGHTIVHGVISMPASGSTKILNRQLNNEGPANLAAGGYLYISSPGAFNNKPGAELTIAAGVDEIKAGLYKGAINNEGDINVLNPLGMKISSHLNNYGLGIVTVPDLGVLTLEGGSNSARIDATHLTFGGSNSVIYTLETGSILEKLTDVTISTLNESLSGLVSDVNLNLTNFAIEKGFLSGSGNVEVSNQMTWLVGKMTGTGQTTVQGGINMPAGGSSKFLNRQLNNEGPANLAAGGYLYISSPGAFNNKPGSELTVAAGVDEIRFATHRGTIHNEGDINVLNSNGITVGPIFVNSGNVYIDNGLYVFNGGYTQNAGLTHIMGGELISTSDVVFTGGLLDGLGIISADVINTGARIAVDPDSTGMTINGNLTFGEDSELFVAFEGLSEGGTLHSIINANTVVLNGTLLGNITGNANNFDGTPPLVSINAQSMSGEFLNIKNNDLLYTLDGEGSFQTNYGLPFSSNQLVFSLFNNEDGFLPADLTLISSDISFDPLPLAVGTPVQMTAEIHNNGYSSAEQVVVDFYVYEGGSTNDFISIGQETIALIEAGQKGQATITQTFSGDSYRLIKVVVDAQALISELREDNNEASQVLQVGDPLDGSAELNVYISSNYSTCQGTAITILGEAHYDFDTLPAEKDFPVQGGRVTVRIKDQLTNESLSTYVGTLTDVNGDFSQRIVVPDTDAVYDLEVDITDFTLTDIYPDADDPNETWTLEVDGVCSIPPQVDPCVDCSPAPPEQPETEDVFVTSQGIVFDNTNPILGQQINIDSLVNYKGLTPVLSFPVIINDLYPVNGELQSFKIAETAVDFPTAQDESPVKYSTAWRNSVEGAHIIQIVTNPGFPQPTSNDEATRLIFVGDDIAASLDKEVFDVDGDNEVSPGDTLLYTIKYENLSEQDLTGAVIIDDYDENSINIIEASITNGGFLENGTIKWDNFIENAIIPVNGIGTVSYEAIVDVIGEDRLVINSAFMETDQAPTVGDMTYTYVTGNRAPICDAGENLLILSDEESVTVIIGTASDEDFDSLTYTWYKQTMTGDEELFAGEVDQDGNAFLDLSTLTSPLGIGEHTLILEVSDGQESCSSSMILTIGNSPPIVAPNSGGTFQVNQDITLRGSISDYDGDEVNYFWDEGTTQYANDYILTNIGGNPETLPDVIIPGGLALGIHEIFLGANDGVTDAASQSIIVEVVDTEDPTINPVATPLILWPANHKMVDVVILANAQDNSGIVTLSVEVYSSEPPDSDGDGNTIPDYTQPQIDQENGIIILQLRAERQGLGNGRTYTIEITATDDVGNSTVAIVEIVCPHDKGKIKS